MKRYKKIKKKIFTCLAVFFMVISNMSIPQTIKAANAKVTIAKKIPYSYQVTDKDGYTVWGAETEHIYADSEIAFCVQPGVLITEGSKYTLSEFNISQLYDLEYIAYVGWQLSDKTDEDYLATQFMIWEELGATINSTSFTGYLSKKAEITQTISALFGKSPDRKSVV